MFENTADTYCSYDPTANSNAGGCAAGKTACTEYTGLTGAAASGDANDIANKLKCSKYRIKTGSACNYIWDDSTNTTCHAPADDAASCTVVAAGITTDSDCDLRTILGCKKDSSNPACVARDACTVATTGSTNDEKATNC